MNDPILLVEDDKNLQEAICETLELAKINYHVASSYSEAKELLSINVYRMVVSDINLKEKLTGLDLLTDIKHNTPQLPVLLITAFSSVEDAVFAIQNGACNYLVKPFLPEHLIHLINRYALTKSQHVFDLTANSMVMKKVIGIANKVAASSVNVLILGESGTGKEVIARYIHDKSSYSSGNFVPVNMAAIPENMLEAMLFGYEKGAYTGAHQSTIGKFEEAHNGTIFLDEIGDMPLLLQTKLLRVLQERQVERLGGKKTINLNIRIIAATNQELKQLVQEKKFREDLYFRLSVFPITLPRLSERYEDIPKLCEVLLEKYSDKNNRYSITEEALTYLKSRSWPGNIRELENVLQRSTILSQNNLIEVEDVSDFDMPKSENDELSDLKQITQNKQFTQILRTLENNNFSREITAKILQISPRTLRYKIAKMKECGIEVAKPKKGDAK